MPFFPIFFKVDLNIQDYCDYNENFLKPSSIL